MYRYQSINTERVNGVGKTFYVNAVYPDIPVSNGDIYLITTIADRLDLMAQDYYGDSTLWWVIASANALKSDTIYPPIGVQLRIPINIQTIITSFKQVNIVR